MHGSDARPATRAGATARRRGHPTLLRALVAAVATVVVSLSPVGLVSIAGAHSEAGEATITELVRIGEDRVRIEVGVVYAGDGHLAEGATVDAVFRGPDGEIGPVPLRPSGPGSSLYTAEVDVPAGAGWTALVDVSNPTARAEAAVPDGPGGPTTGGTDGGTADGAAPTTAAQDESTTGDVADTEDGSDGQSAVAGSDESAAQDESGQEDAAAGAGEAADESDESSPIVLGALALLVVLVAGVLLWRRRERRQRAAGGAQDGTEMPAERSAASRATANRSTEPAQSSSSDGPSSTT